MIVCFKIYDQSGKAPRFAKSHDCTINKPKQATTHNLVKTINVDTLKRSCSPRDATTTIKQITAKPYKGLSDNNPFVTPKDCKNEALSLVRAVEYMKTQIRLIIKYKMPRKNPQFFPK